MSAMIDVIGAQRAVESARDALRAAERSRDRAFTQWVAEDAAKHGERGSIMRLVKELGFDPSHREAVRQAVKRGRARE